MILLVFATAVLVSVVFERQARRHRIQRTAEYQRLGIPVPPPPPKLKRTEAWLNVGLGFLLVALSLLLTLTAIQMTRFAEQFPDHAPALKMDVPLMIESVAFFLAGGMALAWLGWKAVREISRYESSAARVTATSGSGLTLPGDTPHARREADHRRI